MFSASADQAGRAPPLVAINPRIPKSMARDGAWYGLRREDRADRVGSWSGGPAAALIGGNHECEPERPAER